MNDINAEKLEPYKPPLSVWDLIRSTVSEKELPDVKSYIGESLIEYNLDLRKELDTLLEIWKEVGEQQEPPTVTKSIVGSVLPDPPKLKEMLTKEIHMLVKGIQEKNRYLDDSRTSDADKKVIQYAMISHSDIARPSTPMRKVEARNAYPTSPSNLRHIQKSIIKSDIEAVAGVLKDALQNEKRILEHDIEFLQKCVEEEHDIVSSIATSPIEEPTVLQLRQTCKALEAEILSDSPGKFRQGAGPKRSPVLPISTVKCLTPPSPNRVQLTPIDLKQHPSRKYVGNLPTLTLPGLHKRLLTADNNTAAESFETENLEEIDVGDSWITPSWSKCMSDSPPTTADSGVYSRPATCDISSLQERRQAQLSLSKSGNSSTFAIQQQQFPRNGDGYNTARSSDLAEDCDSSRLPSKETSEKQNFSPSSQEKMEAEHRAASIPTPSKGTTIAFVPRPPNGDILSSTRRTINSRRFSRKPVEIS